MKETGSTCGMPAVLMTRLQGSVVLRPEHIDPWLDGLAHGRTFRSCGTRPFDIVKQSRPKARECFIHRDYHPANLLWTHHTVSGVVDWINACRGPAGIDLGHCRVNLAQLFDVPTADAFLSAYQRHAGTTFLYDPYWDLLSLIDILFGPPTVYLGWTARRHWPHGQYDDGALGRILSQLAGARVTHWTHPLPP